MYTTNANLPNSEQAPVHSMSKLKNAFLVICLGIFVALLMNGEIGQFLSYLSEHNFALNAGVLMQDQTSMTP